jgi:hypothetical protein
MDHNIQEKTKEDHSTHLISLEVLHHLLEQIQLQVNQDFHLEQKDFMEKDIQTVLEVDLGFRICRLQASLDKNRVKHLVS